MAAASLIASAREAVGITQRQLADRGSTVQSAVSFVESGERVPTAETLERLLAAARHRLIAVPSVRPDGAATAERIRTALRAHRPRRALRAFLDFADGLAAEEPATRVALTVARPRETGSAAWDAALAAVVHYRLGRASLPMPAWVDEPARTLPSPREPEAGITSLPVEASRVAAEFAQRNVMLDERTLSSV
jgi:transcriptional regulator with XRE-family HTH domain